MKFDNEIAHDVEEELRADPEIDAFDGAIAAKGGVVTLTGFVHSYNEKIEAERAAKRIAGVAAVVNDIEVRLRDIDERPDPEIARDVVAGLKGELPALWEHIKVTVAHGRVKLEGDLEWRYKRENAERAVRRIRGVTGVSNLIGLRPAATTIDVKRRIEQALLRSAEIDVNRIKVEANGSKVVLSGIVRL